MLVVGVGLGGWIAAEIAVKNSTRLSRLVMANAVGVKIGDRETRDIVDIWALMPDEFNALAYSDPKVGERDYKNLPEAESLAAARNREAYARLAWSPYMHNPKLKNRLHRIKLPTLFLWGMADRMLSEKYGRGYCGADRRREIRADREGRPLPAHRAAGGIRPPGARLRRQPRRRSPARDEPEGDLKPCRSITSPSSPITRRGTTTPARCA